MAGITADETNPGFSHFILKPTAGGGITEVGCEYDSIHGTIKSGWKAQNEKITNYSCTVPTNTTATLYLSAEQIENITEGGKPLSEADGVTVTSFENCVAVIEISSGAFEFSIK